LNALWSFPRHAFKYVLGCFQSVPWLYSVVGGDRDHDVDHGIQILPQAVGESAFVLRNHFVVHVCGNGVSLALSARDATRLIPALARTQFLVVQILDAQEPILKLLLARHVLRGQFAFLFLKMRLEEWF
jgi:hypothetical protein